MVSVEYVDVNENIVLMRVVGTTFNQSNVTCIELEDGLVFVDASLKAEYASKFRSDMEERFQKNASLMILTHIHWDHYFGIDAFGGIPTVVSQHGLESLEKSLAEELSEEGRVKYLKELEQFGPFPDNWEEEWVPNYLNTKLFLPTHGVKNEITINSGRRRILLRVIGGHTVCSSCLYIEPDRVLLSGDNLVAEHANNSTCMLALLKPTTVEILKLFEDFEPWKIIPGHGPVVETEYLRESRLWFSD
ncbi:MAG: MBL fold metallo-hydrolase, partial [Candidatus Thorarchaeota archaeon]